LQNSILQLRIFLKIRWCAKEIGSRKVGTTGEAGLGSPKKSRRSTKIYKSMKFAGLYCMNSIFKGKEKNSIFKGSREKLHFVFKNQLTPDLPLPWQVQMPHASTRPSGTGRPTHP
jgi:hypothetical protein